MHVPSHAMHACALLLRRMAICVLSVIVLWDMKAVFYAIWSPVTWLVGYTDPRRPANLPSDPLYGELPHLAVWPAHTLHSFGAAHPAGPCRYSACHLHVRPDAMRVPCMEVPYRPCDDTPQLLIPSPSGACLPAALPAEWYFRSGLDRYVWVYGMACAFVHPTASAALRALDEMPLARRITLRSALLAAASVCGYFYYTLIYCLPKAEYNAVHPFTSWIPITLFIVVRNLLPTLRLYHLRLYGWLGCITLETYISQ